MRVVEAVEQAVRLEQVAHDAEIVRLAVGLILHRRTAVRVHRVGGRAASVPQLQVVTQFVHRRRGLREGRADEVVPETERDHQIAARQGADARTALRHMEVG